MVAGLCPGRETEKFNPAVLPRTCLLFASNNRTSDIGMFPTRDLLVGVVWAGSMIPLILHRKTTQNGAKSKSVSKLFDLAFLYYVY